MHGRAKAIAYAQQELKRLNAAALDFAAASAGATPYDEDVGKEKLKAPSVSVPGLTVMYLGANETIHSVYVSSGDGEYVV